jgi:hypothetical protein
MKDRQGIIWGVLLIVFGGFILLTRMMPEIFGYVYWPFFIVGAGAAFLVAALLTRTGGLAIPGSILGGIGGIFYYQAVTNHWESWAYMWTLIPGFVGIGVILAGLLSRERPHFDAGGLSLIAISAMGFLVFGGAFGAMLGFPFDLDVGTLWPLFLIGIGLITLISALFRKR